MARRSARRWRLIVAAGCILGPLALLAAAQSRTGQAALPPRPVPASPPATADGARISYPAGRAPLLALPGGKGETIRSLLTVSGPLRFGRFVWNEDGVPQGPVWVLVDLRRQTLSVFRDGHEIGTSTILYGAPGNPTPPGRFKILAKERAHRSTLYEADMPYMLRLTGDGIAIHGSLVRDGYASRGCIGVPDAFARRLFDQVKTGDMVAILPDRTVG